MLVYLFARYIERFRSSAPLSREERERLKETEANDFWWLSSSQSPAVAPSGSGVPEETDRGGKKSSRVTPLTTVNLDKYSHLQKMKQNGYQVYTFKFLNIRIYEPENENLVQCNPL